MFSVVVFVVVFVCYVVLGLFDVCCVCGCCVWLMCGCVLFSLLCLCELLWFGL